MAKRLWKRKRSASIVRCSGGPGERPARHLPLFRQKHAGVTLMFCEFCTEFLKQERLLALCLDEERGQKNQKPQQIPQFTLDHSTADRTQKNSGIDRMTDAAIEPFADEFVILFKRDRAAPVRTQDNRAESRRPRPRRSEAVPPTRLRKHREETSLQPPDIARYCRKK